MKNPVFVVLRKYYHLVNGSVCPYSTDGGDIHLYDSYDDAKAAAIKWCSVWCSQVHTLCDCSELPASACQIDNLVFQCFGQNCYDNAYFRVAVDIYQKYVL